MKDNTKLQSDKKKNKPSAFKNIFGSFFSSSKKEIDDKKNDNKNLVAYNFSFWEPLIKWFFVLKKTQTSPTDTQFWKEINWKWDKDIQDNGNLSFEKKEELSKNPSLQKKILKSFNPETLKKFILEELESNWKKNSKILLIIKKIKLPNVNKSFAQLTELSFDHDLNADFSIKAEKLKDLFLNKNINHLIKIFNINKNDLTKYLINNFNIFFWNKNKVIINNLVLNGFDLNNFVFWKKANLKMDYFQNDGCTFKSELLPELLNEKINTTFIKEINAQNLENFAKEQIKQHFQILEPVLKRIENLNFSLNNNVLFYKIKLDWETDFVKGVLKESKIQKMAQAEMEHNFKQWKVIKTIDKAFLLNFIQNQIINKWKTIQNQIQKLKFYNSKFFQSEDWLKIGFDHIKDLKLDGSIALSDDSLSSLSDEKIHFIFKLSKDKIDNYIKEEISEQWKKIHFTLNKIIVFSIESLLQETFWKDIQIDYEKELDNTGNLWDFIIKEIPNWNQNKMKKIINLKDDFLRNFLTNLILKHWKPLETNFRNIIDQGYDVSDQHFWIFTNLNWKTDMNKDGSLNKKAINVLTYKTLNQIAAIKKINNDFLDSLLLDIKQKDKNLTSAIIKKPKFSFWRWLFRKKTKKTLSERLNNRIEVDASALVTRILSYKDFDKNKKILNQFKNKYNSKIINEGQIITFGSEYIRPERYILEMNNVFKFYATSHKIENVIQKINLKIERGDFLVILGPSGAGKTTLLNVMSGIDSVDNGDLLVDGYNLTFLNESGLTEFRRKYVGFVFQQYNLLENLTCLENVEIGSSLLSDDKAPMAMNEIYQFLKIDKLLNKYPSELSGGQQQRFSIARALAKNPELLFCDEPTGALDHKMSKKVMEVLLDVNQIYNITIVLVTHNPVFAKIAKTVVYVENGSISSISKNDKPIHPKDIDFSFRKSDK